LEDAKKTSCGVKIIDIIFYTNIMLHYHIYKRESAMKRMICMVLLAFVAVAMVQAQEARAEKSAKEYIADLTSGGDEKTVIEAAQWLGNKKDKEAVPGLVSLMSDKRVNVRIESAVALGLIGEESAADVLNNALLNDESAEVRYAAILATMRIGSKKSIDAYRQAKEKESDPFIQDILAKMEEKAKAGK
jgi:HEAT repeat protein